MIVAVATARPAQAVVTTAPAGFHPVLFDINGPRVTTGFDLNGDGTIDYYVSVSPGQAINLIPAAVNRITYASTGTFIVDVFSSASAFQGGVSNPGGTNLAYIADGVVADYLSMDAGFLDLTFATGAGDQTGYMAVSLAITGASGAQDAVLTVSEYGFGASSVPEPRLPAILTGLMTLVVVQTVHGRRGAGGREADCRSLRS